MRDFTAECTSINIASAKGMIVLFAMKIDPLVRDQEVAGSNPVSPTVSSLLARTYDDDLRG